MSWLKKHSGAARSHAAYWGGPLRHKRPGKEHAERAQCKTTTSSSTSETDGDPCLRDGVHLAIRYSASPAVRRRGPTKSNSANLRTRYGCITCKKRHIKCDETPDLCLKCKYAGIKCDGYAPPKTWLFESRAKSKAENDSTSPPQAGVDSPRHLDTDPLQHLPPLPSEIKATRTYFAAGVTTFEFFGGGFVQRFLKFDHHDYSIMFSGCLLLSYAYSMALTGLGTKTVLLELKSQVIRCISAKMKSSNSLLSPRCLTAILALGSPIVCLVSQDLPMGLSIWDYINASMRADYLCCQASAQIAQRALDERTVHRLAMRRLFVKSLASAQDPDSFALLQYVSNCMNMYVFFKIVPRSTCLLTILADQWPSKPLITTIPLRLSLKRYSHRLIDAITALSPYIGLRLSLASGLSNRRQKQRDRRTQRHK